MFRRASLAFVVLVLLSYIHRSGNAEKNGREKGGGEDCVHQPERFPSAAARSHSALPKYTEWTGAAESTRDHGEQQPCPFDDARGLSGDQDRAGPFGAIRQDGAMDVRRTEVSAAAVQDPVTGAVGYPGPTLRVRRASIDYPGDSINVLLEDHLAPNTSETCIWQGSGCPGCTTLPPAERPMCCSMLTKPEGMECFHGLNDTNLHFHGLHVSPQAPQDWVLLQLQPIGTIPGPKTTPMGDPGTVKIGTFQYAVNPLPSNQAEGTHWYHPHKHGATSLQVGSGMAGAVIVEGPFDDWLRSYYKGHLAEKVMVVQQIHDLNFNSTLKVATSQVTSTALPLINGQLAPRITMNPGEVQRWRLVGATIEADAQLEIDFDGLAPSGNLMQARQIAMDGVEFSQNNYYCQPLTDITPCDGIRERSEVSALSREPRATFSFAPIRS